MKLQSLRALITIVEQGSFSEAALELGVSQSAMSHAIAELEDELGVRLLDRGRFGAVPTEVGKSVVSHARRLEAILQAIHQEAALEKGHLAGTLRISAFRSAATLLLPRLIARLHARHPQLEIAVVEVPSRCTDVTDALHAGTVDVALTMARLSTDAIFWELLRDPYHAVAPSRIFREHVGVDWGDVLSHPIILSDGPCSWPVRERLASIDPGFRPRFAISEDSTMLAMVAQGLGIALMPELTLDNLPPDVRQVPLRERLERVVGIALLPGALKVPAVRAFLTAVRELFPAGGVPPLGEPASADRAVVRS